MPRAHWPDGTCARGPQAPRRSRASRSPAPRSSARSAPPVLRSSRCGGAGGGGEGSQPGCCKYSQGRAGLRKGSNRGLCDSLDWRAALATCLMLQIISHNTRYAIYGARSSPQHLAQLRAGEKPEARRLLCERVHADLTPFPAYRLSRRCARVCVFAAAVLATLSVSHDGEERRMSA